MDKIIEEKWYERGFHEVPTCWNLLEHIMTNNINVSFEMGGNTSWWCVLRDHARKAIVPAQSGKTIDEAIEKLWKKLYCK